MPAFQITLRRPPAQAGGPDSSFTDEIHAADERRAIDIAVHDHPGFQILKAERLPDPHKPSPSTDRAHREPWMRTAVAEMTGDQLHRAVASGVLRAIGLVIVYFLIATIVVGIIGGIIKAAYDA